MLHSAFDSFAGFRGTARTLIDVFLDVVGPEGNLLMVSLSYSSATYEHLQKGQVFDVSRSPSRMGVISESFRRREGVLRSFHPTHPVLALGRKASWITAGHESCTYPCGPGSPFERLIELGGKIAFLNVPLTTMTFFHYVEHVFADALPISPYYERLFEIPCVDSVGATRTLRTRVFSPDAVRRRRPQALIDELLAAGCVRTATIKRTVLRTVAAADVVACARRMIDEGRPFYALQ